MLITDSALAFTLYIALIALLIDRLFGEFLNRWHPVVLIGQLISHFERHFYKDSVSRGLLLLISVLTVTLLSVVALSWLLSWLPDWLNLMLSGIIASTLLAHRMLFDSVQELTQTTHPQKALSYLVSRDTESLSRSECYKAGMETYAENLSDGVIAPLFYLLMFGLPGLIAYKTINTLDSMVGYRTAQYERFGKASARMDDFANWIPARITMLLIMLVNGVCHLRQVLSQARGHASPNAGYPISAQAWASGVKLGGPTSYFGKILNKPFFGPEKGCLTLTNIHIEQLSKTRNRIDLLLLMSLTSVLLYDLLTPWPPLGVI